MPLTQVGDLNKHTFQNLAVVCGSQPAEAQLGVWLLGFSQGRRIFACSWVHALCLQVVWSWVPAGKGRGCGTSFWGCWFGIE